MVLFSALFITSCGGGGGGGGISFFLTVASFAFSTDEDTAYQGNLTYSTNGGGSITIQIDSLPQNGTLQASASGQFTYTPNKDFSGTDSFAFKANSVQENYTSTAATVSITINAVDDPPAFTLASENVIGDIVLLQADSTLELTGSVSDPDSALDEIEFSAELRDINLNLISTFSPSTADSPISAVIEEDGRATVTLDLSSQIDAGYFTLNILACDESGDVSVQGSCGDDSIQAHFATGYREVGNHKTYNIMGSYGTYSDNRRNTDMLIMSDSASGVTGIERFQEKMIDSIELLYNSSAGEYFDGFFNIMVIEPLTPNGDSAIEMLNDGSCTTWSDNTFCYSSSKLSALEDELFPDIYPDVTAIITALPGRGVTRYGGGRPTTMVQPVAERTARTFMHELGHSHANLGDEYSADGEREYTEEEVEDYSYWDMNVAVEDDPNLIKWSHFIANKTSVPGLDPLASKLETGIFEGSYYSEEDSFRPRQYSVMGCSRCEDVDPGCWTNQFERENCADFIDVHTEGFAIQSILNLFRDPFGSGTAFIGEESYTGLAMTAGIVDGGQLDTSKLKLQWYINGQLDTSRDNLLEVSFDRPTTDAWANYTWKILDTTGVILVEDDIDDPNDCYLGLFDRYYASFIDSSDQWQAEYLPLNLEDSSFDDYQYGYTTGCASGTLMINWSKF